MYDRIIIFKVPIKRCLRYNWKTFSFWQCPEMGGSAYGLQFSRYINKLLFIYQFWCLYVKLFCKRKMMGVGGPISSPRFTDKIN